MDDVNNPQAVTEQPVEQTTTPTATGETQTTAPAETPVTAVNPTAAGEGNQSPSQIENLNKALKAERERSKAVQRELADLKGKSSLSSYDPEDMQSIMSHPFVQDLLLKQAESDIKVGVKDILDQYPQLPESVKKAIQRNPRGFVQPDTTDVQTALLDIQDYLEEIAAGNTPLPTAPQPKTVPIAQTNASVGPQKNIDAKLKAILAKSPEDMTSEDDALLAEYMAQNK